MRVHETSPISLEDMQRIAILAGGVMKTYFTHFGMERVVKTDTTPLTRADTEVNALVIDHVRAISKDVDIVGEEANDRTSSSWQIVCDPVDGTFPYTWGMPVSTFMIGLLHRHVPVMGVIYDPFTDRMYYAERGKGAWLNNSPLKVSRVKERTDRPVVGYVSWPQVPNGACPYNILKVCQYLEERGVTLVNFCSIGYMEAAVATGEFAGTIFPGSSNHDTAPGHIIVSEAGGKVTDIFGGPPRYSNDKIAGHLMSNGHIHDLLVEAVHSCN